MSILIFLSFHNTIYRFSLLLPPIVHNKIDVYGQSIDIVKNSNSPYLPTWNNAYIIYDQTVTIKLSLK